MPRRKRASLAIAVTQQARHVTSKCEYLRTMPKPTFEWLEPQH